MLDIQQAGLCKQLLIACTCGTEHLWSSISFNICERLLYLQLRSVLSQNKCVLYAQIRVVEISLACEWFSCVSAKK